jgi:undecaprenyl-diphosphatase
MQTSRRKRGLALLVIVLGVSVVALRIYLEAVGPLPGERWSIGRFRPWQPPAQPLRGLIDGFDIAARPIVAAATVSCLVLATRLRAGTSDAAFVVMAASGVVVNACLKAISGPTPLWAGTRWTGDTLNFPSGHVVYAVVLGGSIAILAGRQGRTGLVALLVACIVLMGPMRVLGGVHLPSDVVAGYMVGGAWLGAAVLVRGACDDRSRRRRAQGRAST